MNKTVKILAILMVALMVLMTCTPVFAGTPATGTQGQEQSSGGTSGGKTFDGVTVSPDTSSGEKVSGLGNKVLGVIRVVGTIIAVGVLMVIGIKYMMGSAEEKADYKKSMIPYVIGAIIIFGAPAIANMVYQLASGITGSGEGR